jgi:glycosyltransferase involved in cell wall biosynthesis
MRIAVIAPPWYPVPPNGYGGIEWVVALLADGLTERGHEVTLFAPPGSKTDAELVPPLQEVPPEELIGDPGTRRLTPSRPMSRIPNSISCTTTPGRSGPASGP